MSLLPILCYPDPKLHKVAKPVQAVDARIRGLIADMLETMYDAKGIGLAATQVDVHERLIVIDVSEQNAAMVRRATSMSVASVLRSAATSAADANNVSVNRRPPMSRTVCCGQPRVASNLIGSCSLMSTRP